MLPCRRSGCFCLQGNFQRQRKILSPVSVGSSSFEHCRGGTCALKSFEQFELDSRVFCWLRPMMGCRISSRIPMTRMVSVTVTSPLHSVGFSSAGSIVKVIWGKESRYNFQIQDERCVALKRGQEVLCSLRRGIGLLFLSECVLFFGGNASRDGTAGSWSQVTL